MTYDFADWSHDSYPDETPVTLTVVPNADQSVAFTLTSNAWGHDVKLELDVEPERDLPRLIERLQAAHRAYLDATQAEEDSQESRDEEATLGDPDAELDRLRDGYPGEA